MNPTGRYNIARFKSAGVAVINPLKNSSSRMEDVTRSQVIPPGNYRSRSASSGLLETLAFSEPLCIPIRERERTTPTLLYSSNRILPSPPSWRYDISFILIFQVPRSTTRAAA